MSKINNCLLVAACLLVLSVTTSAQSNTDFSGTYSTTFEKKDKAGKRTVTILLSVKQAGDVIEVTEEQEGKTYTRKYKLDGSESVNLSTTGIPIRAKASLKKKTLIIESVLPPNGVAEEKWELSKDTTRLKIASNLRMQAPVAIDIGSSSLVYTRVSPPLSTAANP
jgi:hypothetical protein